MAKRSKAQLNARIRLLPNPPSPEAVVATLDKPYTTIQQRVCVTTHMDDVIRVWVPNVGRQGEHMVMLIS